MGESRRRNGGPRRSWISARRKGKRARHEIAGPLFVALFLLVASIGATVAIADGPEYVPAPPGAQVEAETPAVPEVAGVFKSYEALREREEEREEELAGPPFVEEREKSQHAYEGLSASEAEKLLTSKFGDLLDKLNSDPARFLSDAKLNRSYGEGAATVTSEGRTELMEGPMPVVAENDEGELRKVDLSLEQTAEGFEPQNPLVETVIGASASEGVELGGGGLEVSQVGAEEVAGAELGDKNVFFGEVDAGSDTDLLVSPTSGGVEFSDMLRSINSPETLRFSLDLPEGATLRPVPGGAAEVTNPAGEIMAEVQKPTAVDAQGTDIPVTLEVEGDSVVLRVEHRQLDVAYPVLVDPDFIAEYWANPGWYQNTQLQGLGYWRWTSNTEQFHHWEPEDVQWPGHRGLFVATPNGQLSAGWLGEWYLWKHANVYIKEAVIDPFWRADQSCPNWNYPEPWDFSGFYDEAQGVWNELQFNHAIQQGNTWLPSWGHQLVFGMGVSTNFNMPCWRDLMAGGVNLRMGDWAAPNLTQATGMPSGWVKMDNTQRTVNVSAYDIGLGVQRIRLFGIGGREFRWNQPECSGTFENPCAESRSGTITYETSGSSVYEGPQTFTVQALDPVEHGSGSMQFPLSLDGLPPQLTVSGQFGTVTEGAGVEKLSLPVYNVKLKAEDGTVAQPRSGAKNIKVYMDGVLQETKTNSCSSSCPRALEWTYPVKLAGLTEGKHTLEISTSDFVGNEVKRQERAIEFRYIPATGMKEEYVLQHFVLPDGHNYAEEPEYRGPELAVNVTSGNLVYRERDLRVQAPSGSLELERIYNSQQPIAKDGQWGRGWSLAATPELKPEAGEPQSGTMTKDSAVTTAVELPKTQSEEVFNRQLHATVSKSAAGGYEVEYETQPETAVFNASGRIEETQLGGATPTSGQSSPSTPTFTAAFGSAGTGNGQLAHPAGIAVTAGGNLWVVDENNKRLEQFSQSGEFIGSFGSAGTGNGQFSRPTDVAIDAKGNLWVTDAGSNRIQTFNEKGEYLAQFGSYGTGNGQFNGPESIAIANGHVWVGDTYNARLQEFTESREFLRAVGTRGSAAGQMIEPTGVAIGPGNTVWVADWGNNRVEVFTESGAFVRQFGSSGTGNGQFQRPDVIDVDREGHVWVGDQNNARIQEFDQTGGFITKFGTVGSGQGQFSFSYPMGIAADMAGHLWIADTNNNRVQEWSIPGFVAGASVPPTIDYSYSSASLSKMTLDEPLTTSDPTMTVSTTSGLTTSVSAGAAGTATFSYESTKLKSATDPEGQSKFEYDASNRIKKVELPNGSWAKVEYDSYSRVTAVTLKPAGSGEAKTQVFYGSEPRETKVWGGGNPEITYSIGADGSVLQWSYAESPPKIASIVGSFWGHRNDPNPVENKDQTLFVTAESPLEIASIKVIANGSAVVAEKTCEDNSVPPKHNCDRPEPLEWITNPSEHAAGRLDLEVVASDFLGHSTAERFFVTIPQQPPPDPSVRERPTFNAIKNFRAEYGLDRNNPLTEPQMNRLILELLYEWEAQLPTAMQATAEWGEPMRAPELAELNYRREYTNRAAEVIPEWAAEHAGGSYGGFYVDDRAGGLIYVGFTENQHALVEELKQSSALINPGAFREYPSPPTTSVGSLEATAPTVAAAIEGNSSIAQVTSSVYVGPEGNVVRVGATNPGQVQTFLVERFGSGAPIQVISESRATDAVGRYGSSGPVVAGSALLGSNENVCTAGYGSRAPSGTLRGIALYKYFVLTAGHCFPLNMRVGRELHKLKNESKEIGTVKRSGYAGGGTTLDGEAIYLTDEALRSHSVLNGEPLEAQPIQGVQAVKMRKTVCWSAIFSDQECGRVIANQRSFDAAGQKWVFVARGIGVEGDSGGPVWDPETHKAVGVITSVSSTLGGKCAVTSYGAMECNRMLFTPLLPGGGSAGIVPTLGVEVLKQG